MIVCPHCSHQNPDAAIQCEACYTPLPTMIDCPSCGASVQTDASFCGQCGFNLQTVGEPPAAIQPDEPQLAPVETSSSYSPAEFSIPPLVPPDPLVEVGAIGTGATASTFEPTLTSAGQPEAALEATPEALPEAVLVTTPDLLPVSPSFSPAPMSSSSSSQTQLQTQSAQLLHVQTNTTVELPSTLAVIHIGKPNDRIPPDVDVSGYPHSEIVSRIHADIRVEGDIYYIEDVGSSNGTYINNAPLPSGNRHRLRPGDRIALGKGDKVTFLFQIS